MVCQVVWDTVVIIALTVESASSTTNHAMLDCTVLRLKISRKQRRSSDWVLIIKKLKSLKSILLFLFCKELEACFLTQQLIGFRDRLKIFVYDELNLIRIAVLLQPFLVIICVDHLARNEPVIFFDDDRIFLCSALYKLLLYYNLIDLILVCVDTIDEVEDVWLRLFVKHLFLWLSKLLTDHFNILWTSYYTS